MPDTFGVTQQDIGDQIPALFAAGFTANTEPSQALVTQWISTADAIATLAITRVAGAVPDANDPVALLAKQYIVNYVLTYVARTIYAGTDPLAVKAAADQYAGPATDALKQIIELGTQASDISGGVFNRVLGRDESLTRDLVVTDDDLGGLASPFPGVSRRRQF